MSCYQIAKVHEKRRANVCPSCKCGKAKTFYRYPLTFDTQSQINEDTLRRTDIQQIIEDLVLVKSVMFDNNELICNVDDDTAVPRILSLGSVTHTGGDLTGTLNFTSSDVFNGRLAVYVNSEQFANTEFTFSATAGVNEFDFNFGQVGKADIQFALFNDGIPASTDFVVANVISTVANVAVSPIANGFKITTTASIAINTDYITFNVDAEAGKWFQVVNAGGSVATSMRNDTTGAQITQRNPTTTPDPVNYSIGSGFGQSKTGIQISFRNAGGSLQNGSDIDFTFTNTERIAVDITDASIKIN